MSAIGSHVPRPWLRACWLWDGRQNTWFYCYPWMYGKTRVIVSRPYKGDFDQWL